MNLAMIRALDEKPPAPLCWTLGYWPRFGAATDTLMTPDFEPKEGGGASLPPPPQTNTCPDLGGNADSAGTEGGLPTSIRAPIASKGPPAQTKSCPDLEDGQHSAGPGPKSSYRFTDADRARSLETRRNRQLAETALTCDICAAQATCRTYRQDSVCTLTDTFKGFESKTVSDVIAKLKEIIAAYETRTWQNAYFEELDGGRAKKKVTAMFGKLIEYNKLLFDLYKEVDLSKDAVVLDPESVLGRIFGPQAARDPRLSDSGDRSTL